MQLKTPRLSGALVACALSAAVALRLWLLPFVTIDSLNYLLPWMAHAERAGSSYLRASFTNYAPAYEHLLFLAAQLPAGVPDLVRVKVISFVFDVALALMVSLIVNRHAGGYRAAAAGCTTLLLPTVVINSGFWGQADAIYSTFVVAALLGALSRRPVLCGLALSAALAFKMQALMFAPVLVLLWAAGRQRAWTFALLPLAYLSAALPMLAAGRPFEPLFAVYFHQFGTFKQLALSAPNLWWLIGPHMTYDQALVPGFVGALCAIGALLLFLHRRRLSETGNGEGLLLAAALVLLIVPYVTPKMHERFFFPSDPVLVALAFSFRGYWAPLVLAQTASALAAVPFSDMATKALLPYFGSGYFLLPATGAVLNAGAILLLLCKAWQLTQPASAAGKACASPG